MITRSDAPSKSDATADPIGCVALMLITDGRILAERRKATKLVMPGALAIPGGHIEAAESPEQAVRREAGEELRITIDDPRFVCSLLHRSREFRKLTYFRVTTWSGEITVQEAEAVQWVPLATADVLDLEVDRLALREYLRVFR